MSNFDFIEINWPEIFQDASEAEGNALIRPRYAGVLCRSALERAVLWIFDNDPDLELPFDTRLASLMYEESFTNILKPSLARDLHLVRITGNNAAHGIRVTENQALASLKILFRFLGFLSKYYSEDDPTVPDFDESLVPVADKDSEKSMKLDQRIQELEKQLEEERERRKEIRDKASENEQLRIELERHQKLLKNRKKARERAGAGEVLTRELISEAETRKLFIDVLLQEAGWDPELPNVKEFPVQGMPQGTNPSGNGYVDYVLWGADARPLAVIEAKKTVHSARKGQRQAEEYADALEKMTGQRPVIYFTNGYEYHFWDDQFYPPRDVQGFHSQEELQLLVNRRKERADIRIQPIKKAIAGRPYQYEAIKRVTSAFVTRDQNGLLRGKRRKALLVMATGTGKTRTAIALVDVLTKANWVKRVLFLADRNALVKQAKDAFNEHLPHLSTVNLAQDKEDNNTRVVLSTYPTMINKIDDVRSGDNRFYGVGHFDLVIIDEAHRSVYAKYKAIFNYFDSLLIGLTATPKKDVDRNTYSLFEIEDDNPTFAFELQEAVEQSWLVPPKAVAVPVKFPREGMKYSDLSAEEQAEWELKFGDPTKGEGPDEIDSKALNDWLFNRQTVDLVLRYLMNNGIKVGGEHVGKTIIFAQNHRHAVFIEKRFNKLFPEFSGKFLRVIDNYEERAQNLLEDFRRLDKDVNPVIAVSVDMMDTGIDAPRVVNLVFFKRVKSATKFWQMIGRGTRLYPDLFAPGQDKEHFYIFDFCGNLEFFEENPDGIQPAPSLSLTQQIFISKLELAEIIGKGTDPNPQLQDLRKNFLNQLHAQISSLDRSRFMVLAELEYVDKYSRREQWDKLSRLELIEIIDHLSGLPDVVSGGDETAKRFDLLMIKLMAYILLGDDLARDYQGRLIRIGNQLNRKMSIPAVAAKEDLINRIMESQFWESPDLTVIEETRVGIRDLIKFLDKDQKEPVYTNFEDILEEANTREINILGLAGTMKSYKDRVESFIRKNKHHLAINKLYTNIPLTRDELVSLEDFLFDGEERGTREQFQQEYGDQPLGSFIRSIVGLDTQSAREAFGEFLNQGNLDPNQVKFMDMIITHLTKNGTIDKTLLFEPPFTDLHDQGPFGVFEEDDVRKVISLIDRVNSNAVVA